jgi:hypothetical protein
MNNKLSFIIVLPKKDASQKDKIFLNLYNFCQRESITSKTYGLSTYLYINAEAIANKF